MKKVLMVLFGVTVLVMPFSSFAGNCGDVDNSGTINILDVSYLINYLYRDGTAPDPLESADVDYSGSINILDAAYLINYLYRDGPEPDCGYNCPPTVTDIDGNVYQTVLIGDQCWMMENLKVTHYRNGDPIPNVTDNSTWEGLTSGAYCEHNNDPGNVATYGRLYNWYAVDDSRNIAPEGWHVPTDAEWQVLVDYLGVDGVAGGKLKEAGTTHWVSPNTGATNESGFTALPGGYRCYDGGFYNMSSHAYFWSSTEYDDNYAWSRSLGFNYSEVGRSYGSKDYGFSIRCVKD